MKKAKFKLSELNIKSFQTSSLKSLQAIKGGDTTATPFDTTAGGNDTTALVGDTTAIGVDTTA